jgi:hypothetical protein
VWTPGAGNFTIAAGKLTAPIAFAQGDYQTIETNHSDVTLYSVLTGYDGGSGATKAMPGLIVRFVDANNYWLAQLDSFTGIVTLYEKTGGVFSARGATPPGAASGLALPLSLTAVGNKIIMELGGQAPVYYTSSQHMTATKVGVRVGGDGTTEGLPTYEEFTVMTAFVRSVDNPLIAPLAASWRSVDVAAAVRLYDPVRAKHVMTVSGFNGTIWQSGQFYLDSPEGPAVEEPSNPTRTPDTGTEGYIAASDGVAIKDGVYYKVLQVAPGVTAGHPGDGPWRLKFEKSMDQGLTWTPLYGGAMLPLGASGAFDDAGQHDPYLRLLSNGWFEISFAGEHDDAFSIGRCFTQDFVTFGPTAQLGILGRFGAGANIAGVCMAGDDPVRFAAYYCVTLPGALRHLCMSFTEDGGASWHYLGGVLYPDADVDGEGVQVFDQDVVIVNGKEYIYYAAADAAGAVEGFLSVLSVATRDIP